MKHNLFHGIGKLLSILAIMLLIGLFLLLSIKSFPASQEKPVVYPDPEEIIATPTLISPEALCDQWFSYRMGLPEVKRAVAEEEYRNCVNARKTPSPIGGLKPIPSAPSVSNYDSIVVSRPVSTGTILETTFSPLNSNYRIVNQWYGEVDGLYTIVYAGGRQSDVASGYSTLDEGSWPGIIVLTVKDSKGNYVSEKGGEFWAPANVGPVRIVDAIANRLILVAQDGTPFAFDLVTHRFLSEKLTSPISRSMGIGIIVESGNAPYRLASMEFVNYWYYYKKDLSRITILAGNESYNPKSGILIVVVSSQSNTSEISRALAFYTSMSDGYLRIVNENGEILTLISADDLIYEFDVTSMQFVSLPSGSAVISGIPLKLESSFFKSGIFSPSPTLGVTLTLRPTRTLLPTYNPYP